MLYDLFMAFNGVNHGTVIRKVYHYGVKGRAFDFLASYLTYRAQRIDVNDMRSSGPVLRIEVPQKSILGPFKFLVCINFLPSLVKDIGANEELEVVDTTVFQGVTLDNKIQR
ncbi:hypothetical protein EVAR_86060_1 [Eumeta japonica]|uniref:Reverse transcriptase domain-containing protein n=1 Tax=Eumeta variegata TaxID=151549 RepID=A0A4C1UKD7_EUMVA|nr:hypothetical protein EVAR_86060_1 [Eumeta japonica]